MSKDYRLVFTTDSPVHHYLNWIRNFYGCDSTMKSSLCPVFHTILWGSLGLIIAIPFSIIGIICKRIFANSLNLGDNDPNWVVGMMSSVIGTIIVATIFGLYSAIVSMVYGIGSLSNFWDGITYAVQSCGFFVCAVCSLIGQFVVICGHGIGVGWNGVAWFFTNGELWSNIVYYAALSLLGVIGLSTFGLVMGISAIFVARLGVVKRAWENFMTFIDFQVKVATSTGKNVTKVVSNRIKKDTRNRVVQINWNCRYCNYENGPAHKFCYECSEARYPPSKVVQYIKDTLFGSVRVIGGQTTKTLGFFNVFWEFAKAFKKRTCPLVVFVSPEELQKEAISSAEETAKKNKRRKGLI